ncbi:MAG: hypothetical protein J6D02_09000 [Lachnospira sp.]|nr:hypothetical protein [Lachnospira sp.]
MKQKRKVRIAILIIGIILIITAVLLYYQQEISDGKVKQTASTTTAELDVTIEVYGVITNEVASITRNDSVTEESEQEASDTTEEKQNKKLPNNYEWDEKRWGEPPQIVYDFAENQEKFDFIVSEVDSLLSEGEGFTTRRNNDKLYAKGQNGKQLTNNIDNLLNNTRFNKFTKVKYGHWFMYYDQEEDTDKYIFYMAYAPEMTEEEAWDNGYMKVVGDWYFATVWKV